jgi:hypothetical protein
MWRERADYGQQRHRTPVQFELRNIQMTGTTLTGTVAVKNLQNKRFPRVTKNYDYRQFPSLPS